MQGLGHLRSPMVHVRSRGSWCAWFPCLQQPWDAGRCSWVKPGTSTGSENEIISAPGVSLLPTKFI